MNNLVKKQVALAGGLNVRQVNDAARSTPIIAKLALGDVVQLADGVSLPGKTTAYDFGLVVLPDGRAGWCALAIDGAQSFRDPVAPPAPKKKHKIGVHVVQGGSQDNYIQFARDMKAAGVPLAGATVVNEWKTANALIDLVNGPVIYRWDPTGNDKPDWSSMPTASAAYSAGAAWVQARLPDYAKVSKRCFIQATNEPGYSPIDYAWWQGVMDALRGAGYLAAIFADATGNPDGDDFQNKWKGRIPALVQAKREGHIVVYHTYSAKGTPPGQMTAGPALAFNEMRFKTVWDQLPESARALVALGEAASEHDTGKFQGIDECVNFATTQDGLIMPLDYVLFEALWTLGDMEPWRDCSIDSALPALGAALRRYL